MGKKIVIIGPAHPLRGGIAAFNERLAGAFISNGDTVSIETFSLQYPGFLFPGKTQYSDSLPPENLKINVSINSIWPFSWIKVGRRIKKQKPDLVIIAFWLPFMGPSTGAIAKRIRSNGHSKIIGLIHNFIPHEKRAGDRMFTSYFAKQADAFISMSKQVLKDVESFDSIKPKIYSPHPLYDHYGSISPREQALNKLNLSTDFNYLLFFGIIREYKGLDLALKALAEERLKGKKLKLIVAGEFYSSSDPYMEIIKEYKLEDQVILKSEFIPDDEVENYFNAADLVVQPYKNATQSGITQICFHFNKPVLVTDVGGLGEIIPHGKAGYVVDKQPAAISESIADFYENDRSAVFSENVKELKKKYSWENMIQAIYSLYDKTIGNN